MNIFIEGIPGTGKSTLLYQLSCRYPEYQVYRDGDISPVDLKWCAYMSESEYEAALARYPAAESEIRRWTKREADKYIVAYTRIITDEPGFHKDMERFEIYNGNQAIEKFIEIIFRRYEKLAAEGDKNLFECAFFQNIITELLVNYRLTEEQICEFYRQLFQRIAHKEFCLYYLYDEDVTNGIGHVCAERSDEQGNRLWYQLMFRYLQKSPYGKEYEVKDLEGVAAFFERRQQLEMRVIRETLGAYAVVLPAKKFVMEEIAL